MKHLSFLLVLCILAACLFGCGSQEPGVTFPEPEALPCTLGTLKLTDRELQDLGRDPAFSQYAAFSFHLEAPADSFKVLLYRLENGAWEDVAGGSWIPLNALSGTLLLQFEDLGREALVTLEADGKTEALALNGEAASEGNRAAGFLTSLTEAHWGQQIPVAVQATSRQDRVQAPGLEIWEEPQAFSALGYEEVFLVTVTFRQAGEE